MGAADESANKAPAPQVGAQHLHAPRDDHSIEAVPAGETVHGLRVALVLIGIAITIPAFLTGAELGLAMGLADVAVAIPVGSAFLCMIGCLAAVIAAQSRLTTYMIIEFSFGVRGAKLVNGIISITIFGWFAVTASFFGESIYQAVQDMWGYSADLDTLIVVGSGLVIATTIFGFKAIDKLALIAVPLLFAALLWLVTRALADATISSLAAYSSDTMTLGQGITAVIGGFIVGAIILPDYCRYVRNTAHGLLAAVLHFGVAYPLILFMLAVVSIHSGEKNFISILTALGFGAVGLVVLIFATWTTNTGNLYSNALVLKTIFTRVPLWILVLLAGSLGTVLAVVGVTHYFIDFLLFLGISIPPVAGIYIADYFFVHRRSYQLERLKAQPPIAWAAFLAWTMGTVVAWMTTYGYFRLTSIPACDAITVAFLVYLIDKRILRPERTRSVELIDS
ncbi:cytosine permease [Elongatibacter sediminis]|uniref:Cytosine permease n=1 Tax=Elongatibacter sediminis TaxID=3119006 RepID=A0AAW9R8J0_9GAMM